MRIFLAIAWRNILRNKKRSFITAFAIAFGLMALILMWSLTDSIYPVMIDNMTSLFMGHIQISKPEFVDQPKLEHAVKDETVVLEAVRNNDNIAAWTPRLSVYGLVTYADQSHGANIVGIEPEMEAGFSKLSSYIAEGRFIGTDDRNGSVLGSALAENLDVRLGERVIVLAQDSAGEFAYVNLNVVGFLKTNVPDIDKTMVLVRRADLTDETVFDLSGALTSVAVRLTDQKELEKTQSELNAALTGGVRARTWKEMAPHIETMMETKTAVGYVLVFILLVVVVTSILNTILMSVFERTREFGIMRALGTKSRQVFTMITMEATILSLIGLVAGILAGVTLVLVFGMTGINIYGSFDESIIGQFYIDPVVYPVLNLEHTLSTCIIVMVMVLIVSIYPARKASRLEPITAIKTLG